MKKTTLILLVFFGVFLNACSSQNEEEQPTFVEALGEDEYTIQETEIQTEEAEGVKTLIKFKDEYPAEVGLFQNPQLTKRLAALLGNDYKMFTKLWEVETPILIEDNVLYTTGCEQHNCFANQFILIIDLEKDNINVYRLGLTPADYEEKGTIRLPKGIEAEFGAMMDNIQ